MVLLSTLNRIMKTLNEDKIIVKDLCYGIRYTYALVEGVYGRSLGIVYTNISEVANYRVFPSKIPEYHEIKEFLSSLHITERIAGISVLNALSQYYLFKKNMYKQYRIFFNKDIIDIVDVKPGSIALLIGFIKPIARRLEEKHVEYRVVERNPVLYGERVYHDSMVKELARDSDYIFISGASLSTNTLEYILSIMPSRPVKILVGPSAQLIPDILFEKGIDYVASIRIDNENEVMKLIKLGHGTHSIMRCSTKYVIANPRNHR
ncbi:hypothetical protein J4526_06565 [Desulfurococcaceae archaeon MEX13E-LK6-19]|nr:hypothetical protein J4526_06565 [Desulfurococcaceae archaeon MEX13E-LK6-19]